MSLGHSGDRAVAPELRVSQVDPLPVTTVATRYPWDAAYTCGVGHCTNRGKPNQRPSLTADFHKYTIFVHKKSGVARGFHCFARYMGF